MQKKTLIYSAALALSLGLVACGDKQTAASNASTAPTASAKGGADVDATKVVNAYVGAHNNLSGMFYGPHKGLKNLLQAYKAQNLSNPKAGIDPRLYLSTSSVNNAVKKLEEAQAGKEGGEYAKLETLGAGMLGNAKDLLKQAQTLEAYINSKKYTEDGFALLKAENDSFIKRWEQFNADVQALSDELDVVERNRRLAEIKALEKAGDMLGMHRQQSLLLASEVFGMFNNPADLKNAEKIKAADAKMAEMEATLAKLKTEIDKSPEAASQSGAKTTYDRLNQMLGHWRELKVSKAGRKFDDMIDSYNWAIR